MRFVSSRHAGRFGRGITRASRLCVALKNRMGGANAEPASQCCHGDLPAFYVYREQHTKKQAQYGYAADYST
jgi:hypothetical protein